MVLNIASGEGCPFCSYLSGATHCAFVSRTDSVASFVNPRQYERGALLVIPVEHRSTVLDLDEVTLAAIHTEAARLARALFRAFGFTGLNIFQNNGADAGQHVPHYHVHVVPRDPGSETRRIFQQGDFAVEPFSTQLEIAEQVRGALGAT